ncbi:hypothetical protein RA19_22180 [Leisingera sp. ANG-M1]|uniref:hypothetical protein n=1 Tax=Leisingera sp. ANG-M1 TaxID=1577895 RepID=UPI00057CB5C1|nr:hypothetical protein [Leisingera sp. ANG-M1]KIC07941.1 hypothetical protein RA19_22180 [Leisingera sp. ANG-M1]
MKPAFALSLSSDGISLLFRAKDGWRSVASTPFDTEDLPAALAAMREDAQRLAPEGIHTKLILPNDQIRFLTAETGDLPDEERIAAARRALEGATPYAVDELAFDICIDGPDTHIAAVALETLDEAETFAVEHGFGPVSFVAVPEDSGFLGEPFFGTTRAIRGTEVEPDGSPVAVVGPAEFPAPAETAPITEPEAEAAPLPEEEVPGTQQDASPNSTGTQEAAADSTGAETDASAEDPEIPAKLPPAPPVSAPPVEAAAPEAAGFSSRRSKPAAAPVAAPPRAPAPAPLAAVPSATAKPLGAALAAPKTETADAPPPRTAIPPAPAALREEAPAAALQPETAAASAAIKGKPRYLGVILTAFLLLFMATVAVWALLGETGFLASAPEEDQNLRAAPPVEPGSDDPVAPDAGTSAPAAVEEPGSAEQEAAEIAPQVSVLADQPDPLLLEDNAATTEPDSPPAETEETASAAAPSVADEAAADGFDLPEEGTDTAFLDPESLQPGGAETALPAPAPSRLEEPQDPLAQAARYAATGVWTIAPELDSFPSATGLDELYTASIDQNGTAPDAVALPRPDSFARDGAPEAVASPAAAGAAFDLDERGLVKATPEGTLNPDGITIFLGRPKVVPPRAPDRSDPAAEALAEEVARNQVLSRKRPKSRPADLAEQAERARLGGLSRAELASLRPRQRPASLKPAEAEQQPATAQAVAASVVPRSRPANFANLVDRARRNPQNQVQTAAAVPAAAAAAAPSIPTAASVARRATVNGAINLRKLNLIGVYGTAADRRALIRLPSGRYKKVQVGDRIDGGRVIAIGESRLQYQKSGRNRTLEMPNG